MSFNGVLFAPQLYIPAGIQDVSFYSNALGAVELRRWSNEDGSVHVAEFSIGDSVFQVHEEKRSTGEMAPASATGTTVKIGLFVEDVDASLQRSLEAGAVLVSPAQSYDYGYRQAVIKDPFGHLWMLEKKI